MVNEMFVSIEFNVSWKNETSSFPIVQKLSSTYLFQILEEWINYSDCRLFDLLHAKTGHNRAARTAPCVAMDLFVNSVIEHKIIVGQGELKKYGDVINVQICP